MIDDVNLRSLPPVARTALCEALGAVVAGDPDMARRLLAALPAEELLEVATVLLEAHVYVHETDRPLSGDQNLRGAE